MRTKKEENSIKHSLGHWFIGAKPSRHDILEPFETGKLLSASRLLAIAVSIKDYISIRNISIVFPTKTLIHIFCVCAVC